MSAIQYAYMFMPSELITARESLARTHEASERIRQLHELADIAKEHGDDERYREMKEDLASLTNELFQVTMANHKAYIASYRNRESASK